MTQGRGGAKQSRMMNSLENGTPLQSGELMGGRGKSEKVVRIQFQESKVKSPRVCGKLVRIKTLATKKVRIPCHLHGAAVSMGMGGW